MYACAGTAGAGGAHEVGIIMCNAGFALIAVLKFRVHMCVLYMFGWKTWVLFDRMLTYNPPC